MIIDATDLLIGRMATVIAKKAMLGERIDIVNCENAAISGSKSHVMEAYKRKRERRTIGGPFFPVMPDRFIRRTIRGMIPYKKPKGSGAYKRVMCYIGVPEQFKNSKTETIKEANISKLPNLKFVRVGAVCKELGAKI